MTKYPNFGYKGMPDIGCFTTIILLFLLGACPPLAFIGLIIYGIYKDYIEPHIK